MIRRLRVVAAGTALIVFASSCGSFDARKVGELVSFDALINVDRHVVLAAELTANEEPGDVFDDLDQDLGDGQIT